MTIKNSMLVRASILIMLLLSLVQCRAEQSGGLSEALETQSEEDWYDMDGVGAKCVTPPATCPGFDYEKEFVDSCVAKGGRSKTCGCAMRCSNKIEYTRQPTQNRKKSLMQLRALLRAKRSMPLLKSGSKCREVLLKSWKVLALVLR